MEWLRLTSTEAPPIEGSTDSVTVALISALSAVVVALLLFAGQWLNSRGSRTSASPPEPTPHIGERVAVTEVRTADNARTLDVIDRHVDGIDDRVDGVESRQDKVEWQLADLLAWRDDHRRNHGQLP